MTSTVPPEEPTAEDHIFAILERMTQTLDGIVSALEGHALRLSLIEKKLRKEEGR